jgi:uncharacterized membrane protein
LSGSGQGEATRHDGRRVGVGALSEFSQPSSTRDLISSEQAANALGAIVVLGALIRFSAARNLPPHVDEASTILAARQIGIHGFPVLPSGIVYLQGALYSYLIAPLTMLGISPVDDLVWFRLPSVVAGTIAVLAMYRLALMVLGRHDGALFATFLLAIDPLSVRWSGLARMYGLLQALTLVVLIFYLRLIYEERNRRASVLLIAAFASATFTHIGICVFIPPMAIGAWLVHRADLLGRRRDIPATLLACGLSPLLLFALNRLKAPPGHATDGSDVRHLFVGDYFLSLSQVVHPNVHAWISTFRPQSLPELFPAVLIAGTGLLLVRQAIRRTIPGACASRRASVAVIALLYWIPVISIATTVSDAENRYYVHVQPMAFMLLAMLIADMAQWFVPRSVVQPATHSHDQRRWPEQGAGVEAVRARPATRRQAIADARGGIVAATLAAPCVVAIAVRLPLFDRLSLWLDEGFTILYSRLPWATVLGLDGYYSPHPPLYFAFVKATSLVLPDLIAGRTLSLLASLATVPVIWAIANKLLGRRAALLSSLTLALSPLHVYYAQEARMYALVVFLIALTYLALVSMADEITRRWSGIYACAAVLALYVDYSAAFALAPQVLVLGYLVDRHRKRAAVLIVAAAAGGVAYLPWLPNLVDSVRAANQVERRESYLGSESVRIPETVLSIVGLGGNGHYVQSTRSLLWDALPSLRSVWLILICAVVVLAIKALRGQSLAALIVACMLGTVAVAIWVSQISPAFAERTVLSATLGWALLVGACGSLSARGHAGKLANAAVAGALLISLFGTLVVDTSATKQPWSLAIHQLSSVQEFDIPIVTYSYGHVADTFLDVYGLSDRQTARVISIRDGALESVLSNGNLPDRGMSLDDARTGRLAEELSLGGELAPYVWLLYYVRPGSDDVLATIRSLGYQRVRYGEYWAPRYRVYLDLFALANAPPGTPIDINGRFQPGSEGWGLPSSGASITSDPAGAYLTISAIGSAASVASTSREAGAGLYDLTFDLRSTAGPEGAYFALACINAKGRESVTSTLGPDDLPVNGAQGWSTVRLAIVCPDDTAAVRVGLGASGAGEAQFRKIQLRAITAPGP